MVTLATQRFYLKRNDRLPILRATLQDGDGVAVDLTDTTVRFMMTLEGETTPKVNALCTVEDALTGLVSYAWAAGDTNTAGTFRAEFEVTFTATGKKQTFPNDQDILVIIAKDKNAA